MPFFFLEIDVDGAYFGMSFAHIFLMTFDELVPTVPTATYVPKVFGFKVHSSSNSMPKKIVVLDLNSSASDASSSNNLNSSDNNNGEEGRSRDKKKKDSARNRESSAGAQIVYDLTSDAAVAAASLAAASGGNNHHNTSRSSSQPPYHNIGHANSQHQYQHPQQDQHQGPEGTHNVSQYSASPVQQEYTPDAYYDALARHSTTKNGASHIIYSPNGFLAHQQPPLSNAYYHNGHEVDTQNSSHNNLSLNHSSGVRRALSPSVPSGSDQEQDAAAKRPKTAQS